MSIPDENSVPTRAEIQAALDKAVVKRPTPNLPLNASDRAKNNEARIAAVRFAFSRLPKRVLDLIETDLPSYQGWDTVQEVAPNRQV